LARFSVSFYAIVVDRLDAIAAFVAVADGGAFVAAARRLGRSPAVVTRAVADLERRLGVRLFNRTTRAVALTDAGRQHLERARQILSDVAALESTAAAERVEPSGHLTVAASVVFGRLHVQPLVTEFLRRHPGVDIQLELSDRIVPLIEQGIDVGIRLGHLRDSTLRAIRTGWVRRSVYASPAYLAAHGTPRVPADLARHVCIAFIGTAANPTRWSFGIGRKRQVVTLHPRLTTNLADPAIDAAVSGFGLMRTLSYMVDHLVAAGTLRPILVEYEPPPMPIHVVSPAGAHPPVTTRAFVERAVEVLRAKFAV
jgi:DNA-binding transcriptional LysR family regulator